MMAGYIKLEDAIAVIEEKQKELCPVGRYGRGYVYGTDREKYDSWDEIIDALENIPAADVAPVVHAEWVACGDGDNVPWMCSHCGKTTAHKYKVIYGNYCPNCWAKMDEGDDHAST